MTEEEKLTELRLEVAAQGINLKNVMKLMDEQRDAIGKIEDDVHQAQEHLRRRSEFFRILGSHWWKLLMLIVPIIGFLVEIGVYLRHLPPPKP